jgi:hypothetical protein
MLNGLRSPPGRVLAYLASLSGRRSQRSWPYCNPLWSLPRLFHHRSRYQWKHSDWECGSHANISGIQNTVLPWVILRRVPRRPWVQAWSRRSSGAGMVEKVTQGPECLLERYIHCQHWSSYVAICRCLYRDWKSVLKYDDLKAILTRSARYGANVRVIG